MFGKARCFPSIESLTLSQKLRVRYRNCHLLPEAIRATAPFSTTARRRQEQRREAKTWHGLEWVGSLEWLDVYLTPRKPLKPFIQRTSIRDRHVLRTELLKAICEVFLVHEAGTSRSFTPPSNVNWPPGVQIVFNPSTQSPSIRFTSDEDRAQLISQLTGLSQETERLEVSKGDKEVESMESEPFEEQQPAGDYTTSASEFDLRIEEHQEVSDIGTETEGRPESNTESQATLNSPANPVTVVDSKWKQISLTDMEIKFNLIKRVMQRTGIKLPDRFVQQCSTTGMLYHKLIEKDEPKKLAERMEQDPKLAPLPNVKIHTRRISPIDKEKEVGRWKVIEQELVERGLSVTGRLSGKSTRYLKP